MAPVKRDKIKKLVRKFPRKEVELERIIYNKVSSRITLSHPKVARYIKNNTPIDPILIDVALGHTHTTKFDSEILKSGKILKRYIAPSAQDALKYHLLFQLAMLNIIHEYEDAFRLAHIDEYKLGEISKRAIREHAKVGETHATRISAADKKTDATLEEAYLIKPFNEFASDENLPKIAETLAEALTNIGIHVDKKKVEEAFRKAKPVAESLVKETYMNPTHELVSSSIDEHQYLLEGIKNNKELRQFLVELGGRNVESLTHVPLKSETPVRKNLMNSETPNSLRLEAQKLLGILSGLKFADYSERAVEKALKELEVEIEKLLEERNLELLGVYSTVFVLLERGEFEKAEEFLKSLNS